MTPSGSGLSFAVWVLLGIGGVVALLGMFLARRGLRPRRNGSTPHCANCDYIVGGLERPQCPECGADLGRRGAIVHGERHVRRGRGWIGVSLAALGLLAVVTSLTPAFRQVNWYQYKPTWLVIRDYESDDPSISSGARRELDRRLQAGKLSDAHKQKLAAAILRRLPDNGNAAQSPEAAFLVAQFKILSPELKDGVFKFLHSAITSQFFTSATGAQAHLDALIAADLLSDKHHQTLTETALLQQAADHPVVAVDWLMNYLGKRELAGKLSAAHRDLFIRQANDVRDLVVRPKVEVGESAPYRYRSKGRIPGGDLARSPQFGWWISERVKRITLNGKDSGGGGGASSHSGGGNVAGTRGSSVKVKSPGTYTLELLIEVALHHGTYHDEKHSSTRGKREVKLTANFEAVVGKLPDVEWIEDASLVDAMRKALTPVNIRRINNGKGIDVSLKVENPPVNFAFEIVGRVDGKEHRIAELSVRPGDRTTWGGLDAQDFPATPANRLDIILRANGKVARKTADVLESWKGELIYEAVPVKPQ